MAPKYENPLGRWDRWKAAETKILRLYCSAGMTKPVAELVKDYETAYGVRTEVSYDGSGKLLSTIRAGGNPTRR